MFKTDILFTGFYGRQNTGDDAFIEIASWGARKFWKKDKNRFLAKTSKLPKTTFPTKGYPWEIKRTFKLQEDLLLKNTEAFIYAGGSTIHRKLPDSNIRIKAIQKKMNKRNLKVGAIGVSVGPFKSIEDEKAVQCYLQQMDFLAVRDQASFNYVSELEGLPYTPINAFDLAALLPNIYGEAKRVFNNKKIIGISVCPYESLQRNMDNKEEKKRNSMLVHLIKRLDKLDDIHFKFYIINGDKKVGDLNLTQKTIENVRPKSFEIIPYNKQTKKTWESIAHCDFIISTRLHAAIFACFSNTPFMLNEYHRKCGDFLENVGYNENYRLYNSHYDIDKTADQIIEIINNNKSYLPPLRVKQMKEMAQLNFSAINI